MVTPSLVMVGAPHFLSMTTLRPLGPSVTLTAFASASTPRSSDLRAESLNSSVLAMSVLLVRGVQRDAGRPAPGCRWLATNGQHAPGGTPAGPAGACCHCFSWGVAPQPTTARTSRA